MKISIPILILFIILNAYENIASADVYRYTDDDGTTCYTDAPGNGKAVLVIRESRPSKKATHKGKGIRAMLSPSALSTAQTRHPEQAKKPLGLPVNGIITSATGPRVDPIDGQIRNHNGIDLAVSSGTPVRPVSPGTITYSGNRNGYGNMIIVDHGDGLVTLYAHNSQNMVSTGEHVGMDTVIAFSGSTGRSTGPHLHFEAWRMGDNVTHEFLPRSWGPRRFQGKTFSVAKSLPVRKVVMDDGSIILTNLPLSHP